MKTFNKKQHRIFGITCLIKIKGPKVTIHSFEFEKNKENSDITDNQYEEMISGKETRIFLSAIHLKKYNYDLEKMFNDKKFMKKVIFQIPNNRTYGAREIIIKNIKALKSVEEVIREKASQENVPDSVWC
jgi:hypothetical protein